MSYQATQQIKQGFIDAMLFADPPRDQEGDLLEFDNINSELLLYISESIDQFLDEAGSLIDQALDSDNYFLEDIGHDFYLTRCGHGSGFWDRTDKLDKTVRDELTEIAERFGDFEVFINDDLELDK